MAKLMQARGTFTGTSSGGGTRDDKTSHIDKLSHIECLYFSVLRTPVRITVRLLLPRSSARTASARPKAIEKRNELVEARMSPHAHLRTRRRGHT